MGVFGGITTCAPWIPTQTVVMKALSLPTALLAAGALLLAAAPAYADQDPAQGTAQLPAVPALAGTSEYQALVSTVSPLEALAKKKRCTKTKKGAKKCVPAKLSEDDFDSASADVDSQLDDLGALIDSRADDRDAAIDEWSDLREAFLNDPIEARHESVGEYSDAWLDGGSYTCYRGADLNNCPDGVGSGEIVAINLTGNPNDNGKGRMEIIDEQIDNNAKSLIDSAQGAIKKNCSANAKYGDAALNKLKKDSKKKAKSKKAKKAVEKAKKELAKQKEARARCDAGVADVADNFDMSNLDALRLDLEDAAQAYADSVNEENDNWYEQAQEAADRELERGTVAAERAAESAGRADENAFSKIEKRADRALDRVEP